MDIRLNLRILLVAASLLVLFLSTSRSNSHVELSDLVSVLARCRHFDWTSPVEVEMAERVRQLLDVNLGKIRLIEWNVEVCWQDTSLVGRSWSHEEIKDFVFSIGARLLN